MIEGIGPNIERTISKVEATSATERSQSTRREAKRQSTEKRESKDSLEVSPEGRARLESEQRERRAEN